MENESNGLDQFNEPDQANELNQANGLSGVRIFAFLLGILLIAGSIYTFTRLFFVSEEKQEIVLYFSNLKGNKLVLVKKKIAIVNSQEKLLKIVLDRLIFGPSSNRYKRTISSDVRINGYWISGSVAFVDFSADWVFDLNNDSISGDVSLYSVVNTIVDNLSSVRYVRVLINGSPIKTLTGLEKVDVSLQRSSLIVK